MLGWMCVSTLGPGGGGAGDAVGEQATMHATQTVQCLYFCTLISNITGNPSQPNHSVAHWFVAHNIAKPNCCQGLWGCCHLGVYFVWLSNSLCSLMGSQPWLDIHRGQASGSWPTQNVWVLKFCRWKLLCKCCFQVKEADKCTSTNINMYWMQSKY